MLYAIHARVTTHDGEWEGAKDAPSFYLDSIVSGIITEADAVRVARHVIDPLGLLRDEDVSISAVQVVLDQSPPPRRFTRGPEPAAMTDR